MAKKPNKHSQRVTPLNNEPDNFKFQEKVKTDSNLELDSYYGPQSYSKKINNTIETPGEFPFTRGIHREMYRGRLWTMRQYSGFSTAEESNQRYRYLLEQGQTGLSVAFDLPTQIGYDSDHELSAGEVGRVGVPVSSLEDMEELFNGIPLASVTTSMTINATAPILLAFYLAVAKKQGFSFDQIRGTTQNDILKEYISRGTYIFPPSDSMRLTTDLMEFCAYNVPNWNSISVSGYHMREAGATAIQELAFTLANGIAYIERALQSGLKIDSFASRISFFFVSQNDLFEEVAKFRAARRMWANIMRYRFKAKDPKSWMLRFHTQTAGVTLTAQQSDVNTVRTTIQALAAILGGTQSLHVNARDEALGLPTESSATLALRAQQVLALESGVAKTVDPLAGSYLIENLTDRIENEAQVLIDHIDSLGGAINALEKRYQQSEIANSAYKHQIALESDEKIVIGVNAYKSGIEEIPPTIKPNVLKIKTQIQKLSNLRANRDGLLVESSLRRLSEALRSSNTNVMPLILECAEAYATLGEISDVLRESFGEYKN
ncbi:MAG: methylmalonyl-CoA mutase [Dehalococcoidia bacterium]|nr:methylmalonyl-CoA mutase [Dehalococcoidia bacterium]